jgi:hypothetical protein
MPIAVASVDFGRSRALRLRAASVNSEAVPSRNLYKSMTSHADHKVWHDVYHVETRRGVVYLKLTVVEDLLIISFKEKDE